MNSSSLIARVLAACLLTTAVLAADTAKLTVRVQKDGGGAIAGAAIRVTSGGQTKDLVSDGAGNASCDLARNASFTATVTAAGYDKLTFSRALGAAADFAIAVVIMVPPRQGVSRVGEWRIGRTNEEKENPEKDFARFNFSVKYYKNGSPINGATITLARTDGSVFATLTTNALGAATVLVPENTVLKVKVTAAGYAEYNTALAPGQRATSRQVNILMRKSL